MYKLLIMGDEGANDSVQMITRNIRKAFENLNVKVFNSPFTNFQDLPKVDFVLIVSYFSDEVDIKSQIIKHKTQCLKVCSLMECIFPFLDHSFLFNGDESSENYTVIPLPADKKVLFPTEKDKKTILIDHYWEKYLNTFDDWTYQIEIAVEELLDEGYKFYRMIRFKGEENNIKLFENPIFYSDYETYLKNTEFIETYIITHKESYAYGVIDMACRGTRICTPPNFLPKCMIDRLNIPVFSNKQELLSILRNPIEDYWESSILKCTDYNDIAMIIHNKFRKWKK